MAARLFTLQSVNGTPQPCIIQGGATGSHRVRLVFAANPSAGTVTLAWREVGSKAYTSLTKATNIPVTSGEVVFRIDGWIVEVRVTFTGLAGGSTPELWLESSDEPVGLYTGLAAITTQPYTEANVKNGLQYNLRAVWPLGNVIPSGAPPLNQRKIWFKTNEKPVIVKLRQFQYIAEEMRIELFIGPTGVSGGTDLSIHNYNGVSPIPSTVQAKKNVTIINNGTPFDTNDPEYFFGGSNDPQRQNVDSIPLGRERILPANSEFAVVISNTGTGNARAQYFLDFYEGSTDLPL